MIPVLRLAAFLGIQLLAGALTAQEWYVATSGNDNGPGSSASPFATIGKGVAVAKAGDTVWIKPGTYPSPSMISPANSGTSTAPITIRNQGGGEVIIDAQSRAPGYDWDGAFTLNQKSWIIIDGLRVINSRWGGFWVNGGSDIVIRNCSTFNTGSSGIMVSGGSRMKVLNNRIQRACQFPLKDPNKGTQECITMGGVSDFEVAYNTVFDRMVDVSWGGEGIDCKGSCKRGKVHHNTVYDLVRVGLYVDAYGGQLDDIELYANTVINTYHGIIVGNEVNGGLTNNVRVHDNLVRNCPRRGISTSGYDGNGPVRNVQIYNNTVVGCGFQGGGEGCGLYIESSNPANANFVVRNNIFANNNTQMRLTQNQSFVTLDRNLVFGTNVATGSNLISADPRFVNASAGDYRLAAGSPAIDAALGSPVSAVDRDDKPRPIDGDGNGSAIADLGAFERSGGGTGNAAPTVSLATPTSGTVGSALTVSASASDSDGSVAKVEFFVGSTLVGTDTSSPYSASWTPGSAGTFQVTAKATDNLGASTVSAAASVVITAAGGAGTGLTGVYHDNRDFTGTTLTRTDATIDFTWGNGAPGNGIAADTFSVRWTGQIEAPVTGSFAFHAIADDGVRVTINGTRIIDRWVDQSATETTGTIALTAGRRYDITMEYYENGGDAVARLLWTPPGASKVVVPRDRLYPGTSAPANLVRNGTFEADGTGTQTPSQWVTWSQNGAADENVDYVEGTGGGGAPRSGSWKLCHWRATGWSGVSTYQTVTGLSDGQYTLRAWVRASSTGITGIMYAKRHNSAGTSTDRAIPVSTSYQQISIPVLVENGQCEFGFYSTCATGGSFIFVDDVEFVATPITGNG